MTFFQKYAFRSILWISLLGTVPPISAQVTLPETFEGGFRLDRPVTSWNPGNLFELIDGQAVFYLSYGFTNLQHAFYQSGDGLYKVDVYRVRDRLSAMGCLREQRDDTAEPLAIGAEGYLLDYLAAFYQENHYVEIVPETGGTRAGMTTLAGQIAALLPGGTDAPAELALFPRERLIEGSETYFGSDLLSYSFLGRGLSAEYRQDGTDRALRVFVSFAENPDSARAMQAAFASRLTGAADVGLNGIAGTAGTLPYRGDSMLFAKGNFAAGCIGIADRALALDILGGLLARLDDTSSGSSPAITVPVPAGFAPLDSLRVFGTAAAPGPDGTIFDYIDGGGLIYLSHGMLRVYHRVFIDSGKRTVTADVFDMGTSENARAAFEDENICPSGSLAVDAGTPAKGYHYAPDYFVFALKSRYLVNILTPSDALRPAIDTYTMKLISNLPGE